MGTWDSKCVWDRTWLYHTKESDDVIKERDVK